MGKPRCSMLPASFRRSFLRLARHLALLAAWALTASCRPYGADSAAPIYDGDRAPYLQRATPTGITVRWRSERPTTGRVRYGVDARTMDSIVDEPAARTDHEVVLAGLAPATSYTYAVGSTTAADATVSSFVTPPPSGEARPTRIWAFGDSGTGRDGQRAVRDAFVRYNGAPAPDLWLLLGDNAYPDGNDRWYQRNLFAIYPEQLRRSPLWPALGNHDVLTRGPSGEPPFIDIFTLPAAGEAGGAPSGSEHFYAFDHANVHCICLDSAASSTDAGSPMLTWLADDLAVTTQTWIIAYWHHSPYSRGSHDSDIDPRMTAMRERVLPILEQGGVDLVLGGHSHDYERSFLIDGHYGPSSSFTPAMLIDGSDGRDAPYQKTRMPHAGTVYIVAGSGGQLDSVAHHPVMAVSESRRGSVIIDVDGARMDARFLSSSGTIDDAFAIVKTATVGMRDRAGARMPH